MSSPLSSAQLSNSPPLLPHTAEEEESQDAGAPSPEGPAAMGALSPVNSSDEEFELSSTRKPAPMFYYPGYVGKDKDGKERKVSARLTTVPSVGENIKGGELIAIVHDIVMRRYRTLLGEARESGYRPFVDESGSLKIQRPEDWFLTLGGWKENERQTEVQEYAFSDTLKTEDKKFASVRSQSEKSVFEIRPEANNGGKLRYRIHCPQNITKAIYGKESTQTDHPYSFIYFVLEKAKTNLGLSDPEFARYQLNKLRKVEHFNPELCRGIGLGSYLDYLNALMFGVEPTGLNAGLVTSLMTLDLITKQKLTYERALIGFEKEVSGIGKWPWGGVYPFANPSEYPNEETNAGTYQRRESFVQKHAKRSSSLKKFRSGKEHSPVAVKEALLIRHWLRVHKVIDKSLTRDEQIQRIKDAIRGLVKHYFFNDVSKPYAFESKLPKDGSGLSEEALHAPAASDSEKKANSSGKNKKQKKAIVGVAAPKGKKRSQDRSTAYRKRKVGAGPEETKKVARKKKTETNT